MKPRTRWFLRQTRADIQRMSAVLGISETTARIMALRGIKTKEEAENFLSPQILGAEHDGLLMKDMRKAVDKLLNDISCNKKITVFGDYDVDGVMSTVILIKSIRKLGGNVSYYLPHRQYEGYGLNLSAIDEIAANGTNTLVTCDNGITAVSEIKHAVELGVDVIVLDHHEPGFIVNEDGSRQFCIPEAYAVVDPKREDCEYPNKNLCAAAVCYKFCKELFRTSGFSVEEEFVNELLSLASVATVCDLVDLLDENRAIVKFGLEHLAHIKNHGMRALMAINNLQEGNEIGVFQIGYMLGPCINASGRLDSASVSVDLFLCKDQSEALSLAGVLYDFNTSRKNMTATAAEEIIKNIEASQYANDAVLVVYDTNVHESIAGIVAGKIKEKLFRPVIVLTRGHEANMAKGSARSILGYNIFEELQKCKHLFYKFGGHPMAAGLSLNENNIDELRRLLNQNCTLSEEELMPKISLDAVIATNQITMDLWNELVRLEPFGKGNEAPTFGCSNVGVKRVSIIGAKRNTVRFLLEYGITAMGFNMHELLEKRLSAHYSSDEVKDILASGMILDKMDFVFKLRLNDYNGNVSLQMVVEDFRISENK